MAIARHVNRMATGVFAGAASGLSATPPARPPAVEQPSGIDPSRVFLPDRPIATLPIDIPIRRPPFFPPGFPPDTPAPPQTTTQLARAAISQLNGASPQAVTRAVNAIRSRSLEGPGLMTYLERKTPIQSVLERNWTDTTRKDVADAFQMAGDEPLESLDSIVSIAILSDNELEEELLIENTPQTTPGDLMENRRVVWQYPPPGTVLQPPYVVLVAVEYRDVASAQDVVRSIMGELGTYQGLRLPRPTIQKIG